MQTSDSRSNESLLSRMLKSRCQKLGCVGGKNHLILSMYKTIPITLYCRALATGVQAEYLFLTLFCFSTHPEHPDQPDIRAVGLVS
jgi:hypothetical protein